jgi:dihydrofolate synthase/folylpolyglutamate synthase
MNLEAWLALLEKRHPTSIDLGLERCGRVYRRLNSPRPAKRVFTVAGTNGKGSTVAYIACMSRALGQRVGTYTSPHISRFNERIQVQGKMVSDETLIDAFEQVEAVRGDVSLTYFEFTTLAGLLILQQARLDCAVLEVGLGGRLDTVNLVDADCVVITPIGLDHQDFLGPDIDSIAAEKAGVMRKKVPVVCTEPLPPKPIIDSAAKLRSPLHIRGRDFDLAVDTDHEPGMFCFSMADHQLAVSGPSMQGHHQLDNLAAALAAVQLMNADLAQMARQVSDAIARCQVPGRLQRVAGRPEVLLDVGHNELAASVIADVMLASGKRDIICVLAMLADKSAETVVRKMQPVCRRWLCTSSPGPRGQSAQRLAQRIASVDPGALILPFEHLPESLEKALSIAKEHDTILVFGSFTTVSAALDWLTNCRGHELPDAAKLTCNDD